MYFLFVRSFWQRKLGWIAWKPFVTYIISEMYSVSQFVCKRRFALVVNHNLNIKTKPNLSWLKRKSTGSMGYKNGNSNHMRRSEQLYSTCHVYHAFPSVFHCSTFPLLFTFFIFLSLSLSPLSCFPLCCPPLPPPLPLSFLRHHVSLFPCRIMNLVMSSYFGAC